MSTLESIAVGCEPPACQLYLLHMSKFECVWCAGARRVCTGRSHVRRIGDPCTVRTHVGGVLYGEVKYIMGNGHRGSTL